MKSMAIIPILLICLLFPRYAFSQRIQKDGLPPDYNCTGCILVILKKEPDKNIHKINEMIENKLIRNYNGKSVFITATDLGTDSLYKDENVYRFVLNADLYTFGGSSPRVDGRPGSFNYTQTGLNLHLYDRLTKNGYPQLSNWPSWAKNMEKVAEALNKLIKNR